MKQIPSLIVCLDFQHGFDDILKGMCVTNDWISFKARTIFEKATKVNYKQVDNLAAVWCEYGEMELRHENYDQALRILRVRWCWS